MARLAGEWPLVSSNVTPLGALAVPHGKGWAPMTGLCSAHYFDERSGLVAIGWYEEGTRFLDVRDPAGIRQVGYWVPTKGETWATYFPPTDRTGEIVYSLDFARGIDVLRIGAHRPHAQDGLRLRVPLAERAERVGAAPAAPRYRAAHAARLGQLDVRQPRAGKA